MDMGKTFSFQVTRNRLKVELQQIKFHINRYKTPIRILEQNEEPCKEDEKLTI
jgi:hypothetical protein